MPSVSRPFARIPVVLGFAGVAALTGAFVIPAFVSPGAAWPVFAPVQAGCQKDRPTQRHIGGAATGTGRYMPCLIDTGTTTGEPGLAISRDGTLLRSVVRRPTGILVSTDAGAQWIRRDLPTGARDGIPDGYIDPVTDRYFYSGLGESPVYSSDDKGATWHSGSFDSPDRYDWNKVFSGPPVTPRVAGYPTNIYYCNMTEPGGFQTGSRCFRSIDGGRHFRTSGRDPYARGDCADPTQPKGSGMGRGIVDPRDGTIYAPVHFCGRIEVSVSRDEGATWSRRLVVRTPGSAAIGILNALASPAWRKQLMNGRSNIVPAEMAANQFSDAMGIDGAGRLYFVWIDEQGLPVLSWSGDHAQTWSQAARIGAPDVVQVVLPSITVAADGRIGFSYYGTTDRQSWTGYLGITSDGIAASPTVDSAAITRAGTPLMPEACCWASGPQEYTVARWAPDGSLWGAFAATTPKGDARGVLGRLVRR